MAQLVRDRIRSFNGVWFLEKEALEEFDKRIDVIVSDVDKHREANLKRLTNKKYKIRSSSWSREGKPDAKQCRRLRAECRKEVEETFSLKKTERKLTLRFKGTRAVEVERFSDAMSDTALIAEMPVGFTQTVEGESFFLRVELKRDDSELVIDTSFWEDAKANKAFSSIDQWREDYRVTDWVFWWRFARLFSAPIFLCLFGFGTIFLSLASQASPDPDLPAIRDEAYGLLQGGISEAETDRAIGLILRMLTGPKPPATKPESYLTSPGMVSFYVFAIMVAILLIFAPRSAIGIGRGTASIRRQRRWIATVERFMPAAIAVDVLLYLARTYAAGWFVNR